MRHPTTRRFSGALLGALAVMSLHGCKRIDMVGDFALTSPSPTAYLEDSVLTSRVRAALILSPVENGINIGVETHQGMVLLTGKAANPTQIDLAVFVAQTVTGVRGVDSFMFSTGTAPMRPVSKGYTPDLKAWRAQRQLGGLPRNQPIGPDASVSSLATPATTAALPPPDGDWMIGEGRNRQSRWVSIAHNVLGIRSIQDELRIKQQ
jgi:hyperosmotically inducible protein